MRQRKRIDDGQGGIIVLVVPFVTDGRIDGRVPVMCFLYSEYGGLRMKERSMGVANDRMVDMVLL